MLRRNEDQVWNDDLRRLLGEDHVYGGGKYFSKGIGAKKPFDLEQEVF